MRKAARSLAGIAVALAAIGFSVHGSAQPAPQPEPVCAACCYHPQSPRSLTAADWDWTSTTPTVLRNTADSISYQPRAGVKLVLHRCSQHYHCRIENVQACPGQRGAPAAGESECPANPPVGSWVEIHTVYHNGPVINPTPEGLDRCLPETLVVVGYHAKVTSEAVRPPVPVHFGPPSAEWSGSATNVDPPPPAPPDCKAAAYWSFALGCDFKVSEEQLKAFTHPDGARALQTGNRLSHDLTHVVASPKHR
jgi:hypothetical protein